MKPTPPAPCLNPEILVRRPLAPSTTATWVEVSPDVRRNFLSSLATRLVPTEGIETVNPRRKGLAGPCPGLTGPNDCPPLPAVSLAIPHASPARGHMSTISVGPASDAGGPILTLVKPFPSQYEESGKPGFRGAFAPGRTRNRARRRAGSLSCSLRPGADLAPMSAGRRVNRRRTPRSTSAPREFSRRARPSGLPPAPPASH